MDSTLTRGMAHGERIGLVLAAKLPGRLVPFPHRDLLIRRTITVIVAVAILGLFVYPGLALAADGSQLEEDHLLSNNPIEPVADNWGVSQSEWTIFANPGPREYDRYFVFPAQTTDGEIFDIFNEREMTYDRPDEPLHRQYGTYRERFFMNTVRGMGDNTRLVESVTQDLCDTWADEHGVDIRYINLYEVREDITPATADDPDNRSSNAYFIAMTECHTRGGEIFAPPNDDRDE